MTEDCECEAFCCESNPSSLLRNATSLEREAMMTENILNLCNVDTLHLSVVYTVGEGLCALPIIWVSNTDRYGGCPYGLHICAG